MSTSAQRGGRRRRAVASAVGGVCTALALAPAAFAGTASVNGTALIYDAGPGETNQAVVTRVAPDEYRVDDQVTVAAGPGCSSSGSSATCRTGDQGPFQNVAVTLGDRADTGLIGSEVDIPARVDGGDGQDLLDGGGAGDLLIGGAGDDVFSGSGANDTYDGGPGNDTFTLGFSSGDDAGADTFLGGPGVDAADYSSGGDESSSVAQPPVSLTLDDVANDGRAGEGDNLVDVEDAFGGDGDDTVIGNGEGNTLSGGSGRDRVEGGPGVDSVDGGADEDFASGGDGADDVLGGSGDDAVDAGPGDDNLFGGAGSDGLAGGAGDDNLDGGTGSDALGGGEGVDTVDYSLRFGNFDDFEDDEPSSSRVVVTLDGTPDDGFAGENDNAGGDVENVATGAGGDLVRGGSAVNGIITGAGNDIVDTRDQVSDSVVCGAGFDTVRADGLDQVDTEGEDRCERVEVIGMAPPPPSQPGPKPDPSRVRPQSLVVSVSPGRDRRAPFAFRTRGRLSLPTGLSPASACKGGRVSVQIKRGNRTVSTRRVSLRESCTFSSKVRFKRSSRLRGRLKVTARFLGNDVLLPVSARSRSVRAG